MDKLHIWLGRFNGTIEEFRNFFDLTDFYNNWESEDGFERCEFCKYIDNDSYDNDFIGFSIKEKNLQELTGIIPDAKLANKIYELSSEKGLNDSNAILYYGDEDVNSSDLEENFKGLTYLGEFDWD